mmetsp:Transcript_19024/g.45673  ORF Transcript_19024/g.45673 Transcript_19024/m.45673 type:complete len:147 (-) Transcript_19024:5-445(-)
MMACRKGDEEGRVLCIFVFSLVFWRVDGQAWEGQAGIVLDAEQSRIEVMILPVVYVVEGFRRKLISNPHCSLKFLCIMFAHNICSHAFLLFCSLFNGQPTQYVQPTFYFVTNKKKHKNNCQITFQTSSLFRAPEKIDTQKRENTSS